MHVDRAPEGVLHAQVSLGERTVRTLAGNGAKAADDYVGGRKGRMQQLNSPWDLALDAQVRPDAGCL